MTLSLRDFALAPVCVLQLGMIVMHGRLPEARGPRRGALGTGPALRLLILGDSSAAGVGVERQEQALLGQMLRHLAPKARVTWQLVARSGATTGRARRMLRQANVEELDVAVLALGVNDVLRGTRACRFRREQAGLMQDMRKVHGVQRILVSAVPPLGEFPIFQQPLRRMLGTRAAQLDDVLREVCACHNALHVPFRAAPVAGDLARDGLHPGAPIYAEWGARMAGLALAPLS